MSVQNNTMNLKGGMLKIIKNKVMSFFPKKGWIYIIINSLAPGVFKVGCSASPIIDENGKLIGRCRGYYNHFPVGKWKLVFSKEVEDMSYTEMQLISFFSKECKLKNISQSKEWFLGDWKQIKLFNSFSVRKEKQNKKLRPSEVLIIENDTLKKEKKKKSEKMKLAHHLTTLNIIDERVRWSIYSILNLNSLWDLRDYEYKFGSIKHYAIQQKKHNDGFSNNTGKLLNKYGKQLSHIQTFQRPMVSHVSQRSLYLASGA
jgi:hypothetical protein